MTLTVRDSSRALDQYEALRQEALDVAALEHRGHGLSLFLTRGMTAWFSALTALAPQRCAPSPPSGGSSSKRVPSAPACVRSDLTAVLADMVLACSQEAAL